MGIVDDTVRYTCVDRTTKMIGYWNVLVVGFTPKWKGIYDAWDTLGASFYIYTEEHEIHHRHMRGRAYDYHKRAINSMFTVRRCGAENLKGYQLSDAYVGCGCGDWQGSL